MNMIAINNVGYQVQSFEVVDWVIEKKPMKYEPKLLRFGDVITRNDQFSKAGVIHA